MRGAWFAAAIVLGSLAAVGAPVAGEDPLQWETWVEDAVQDATLLGIAPSPDPRADVYLLEVAADDERLHVRLTSAATGTAVEGEGMGHVLVEIFAYGDRGGGGNIFIEYRDGQMVFHHAGEDIDEEDYGFAHGSVPWSFHGWVDLEEVVGTTSVESIHLESGHVTLSTHLGQDEAVAESMYLYRNVLAGFSASHIPLAGTWVEQKGPDFAGGPSIAIGPDGTPRVAYVVYREGPGTEVGLWLATVSDAWDAKRIAGFSPVDDLHEDDRTRTQIAMDKDRIHILYAPCPDQGCATKVRLVSGDPESGWTQTDAPDSLKVGNTHRDVHELAVQGDRIITALMLEDGALAITEVTADGWKTLHRIEDGRLPRVAFGRADDVHVVWMEHDPDQETSTSLGSLWHAAEADGWVGQKLLEGVEDRSGFWETSTTDGSYALAVDPEGRPCIVYELRRAQGQDVPERGFGCIHDGTFRPEPTPIEPVHGNIQLTMRMAFDAAGDAHIASGYGGLDLYSVRTSDGAWGMMDLDRGDAWDMTATPDGVPVIAYTQPHGGTTVALSSMPGGMSSAKDEAASEEGTTGQKSPAPGDTWDDAPDRKAGNDAPAVAGPLALLALLAIARRHGS